jgi:hypothetical protein
LDEQKCQNMLVWLNEHATFANENWMNKNVKTCWFGSNENWMNKNVKTCWFGSMSQKWFRGLAFFQA